MKKEITMKNDLFFPPLLFSDIEAMDQQIQGLYSQHLLSMGEPSLWAMSEDEDKQAYRFLWLRTFHYPISIRLEIDEEGMGNLTTRITDGAGGFRPGKVIFDETLFMAQEKIKWFLTELDAVDFWHHPIQVGGIDGAEWILEGVKDGKYHLMSQWSPKEGPFRETMLLLTQFAHIYVEEIY